ncbi:histone-lysine N-methyltransferase pr-set7 [Orussus abietinus]|uniref:histone-lysine N-methyltransferase pr-set7 n=1 Tax=Orussus abietinus TaxID=222816 RepID=UPI000626A35D|nr:histone-lysine N-methyltransferase pr-set7 [Orussus abietinus]
MVKGRRRRVAGKGSVQLRSITLIEEEGSGISPCRKETRIDFSATAALQSDDIPGSQNAKLSACITTYFTPERKVSKTLFNDVKGNKRTTHNRGPFRNDENIRDLLDKSIISDNELFKTDETPVAVPIHSPSTPHRINMPTLPLDESDVRTDDIKEEKFTNNILNPMQPVGRKANGRARKKGSLSQRPERIITTDANHKLTDYFPVRRSVRKCKKTVLEERQRDLEKKVLTQAEDGLEVRHFAGKGRGVVTTCEFSKGSFVVEYIGELIDQVTAKKREMEYAKDQNTGCYMYYFQYKNHQYCVDATAETDKLGRLVNHSRNGNLVARIVDVDSVPHLVLTAKEDIPAGVEVTYDYGDRSREAIRNHPWLAL